MLTVVNTRASISLAAGKSVDIGLYEVPIDECGDIYNRLGSKVIYVKDTALIRAKSFGIAAVAYSFNNLVRCECHR